MDPTNDVESVSSREPDRLEEIRSPEDGASRLRVIESESGSPHLTSSVPSKEKQAGSPKKPNLPTGKTLGKEATIEKKKECDPAKSSSSRERLTQVKRL
ncbi:hypothetical protein KIN20_017781 [Parelaphostrongylus tenuis]|uniref:Uncharacterized protein n=1 Tax=Parelaphostrongylus tenuis TaxID=148309 RepID=A0AAD5MID3_PARTN|nr:hypothetical protein KIN20_017781 [Parelaphostrongylus tenuis]